MVECLHLEKRSECVLKRANLLNERAGFLTIADRRKGARLTRHKFGTQAERTLAMRKGILLKEVVKRDRFDSRGLTALLSRLNSVCVDFIYSLNDGGNK